MFSVCHFSELARFLSPRCSSFHCFNFLLLLFLILSSFLLLPHILFVSYFFWIIFASGEFSILWTFLIRVSDPDPHGSAFFFKAGSRSAVALEWKAGSGFALKSKFRSFRGSKWSHGGSWMLKMEAWRVCRPVIADSVLGVADISKYLSNFENVTKLRNCVELQYRTERKQINVKNLLQKFRGSFPLSLLASHMNWTVNLLQVIHRLCYRAW